MAKPGRPAELGVPYPKLLSRLRRVLGPTNRTNMAASQRGGAKVKAQARLNRAWRDLDSAQG
jgi:hypothetical protein